MAYDVNKLFTQLQNTGLQNRDQPLYQVIYLLIQALSSAQGDITRFSSLTQNISASSITNIYQQIIQGNRESSGNNRVIPGPKGDTGSAGSNGATGPSGSLGVIKHYTELYPRYVPVMGNQGNQGITGAQGSMGPVIAPRIYEVSKRIIQITAVSGNSTPSGLVYLGTQTASGSAQLDFTSLITATYNKYIFELENIVPATDNVDFLMRTSTNNGSSFDSGASDYQFANFVNNTGSFSTDDVCSAGATAIKIAPTIDNGSTTGGINGTVCLYNPLNASQYKSVQYHVNGYLNDNQFYNQIGSGWRVSTADIDAVRFLMSSGNFTGVIRMYGVKNS